MSASARFDLMSASARLDMHASARFYLLPLVKTKSHDILMQNAADSLPSPRRLGLFDQTYRRALEQTSNVSLE